MGTNFADVVKSLIGLINVIIPVLAAAAMVFFFIGIVRFVYNNSDEKAHIKDKELIIWGLVAIFVLFSIWGIVRLLITSFFPS